MKRGDIVVASEKGPYAGKPRPWLVLQNSAFLDQPSSITVCVITSEAMPSAFRVAVMPDPRNNLRDASVVLLDKILTLRESAIDSIVGSLDDGAMTQVDEAARLWLNL